MKNNKKNNHQAAAMNQGGEKQQRFALASGALLMAVLAMTWAQRAQAQSQQIESTTLTPTQNPCTACSSGNSAAQVSQQQAAPPPGAPTQALPATPAPQTAFKLNDLRLNGAQALPADALNAVTQPYIGRTVTLSDLEQLAGAITQLYRDRGYFLAQAVVPVQTVRDGVVEISIIEGR
ncbi:MAG: ShlB/FhaC/HecB family hemolysin secretion/activation protein, partial [Proteobacteria bacterium]|nr:ShlB/FhaC/HecB family hemolysin secretion/activation protein [Pseudomonadota bacterium]